MRWAHPSLLLTVASPAFAAVKEVWWNITYVENANPDGLQERRVVGVNGTWPCAAFKRPCESSYHS
jgi:iron transport multicopper oxidase